MNHKTTVPKLNFFSWFLFNVLRKYALIYLKKFDRHYLNQFRDESINLEIRKKYLEKCNVYEEAILQIELERATYKLKIALFIEKYNLIFKQIIFIGLAVIALILFLQFIGLLFIFLNF